MWRRWVARASAAPRLTTNPTMVTAAIPSGGMLRISCLTRHNPKAAHGKALARSARDEESFPGIQRPRTAFPMHQLCRGCLRGLITSKKDLLALQASFDRMRLVSRTFGG